MSEYRTELNGFPYVRLTFRTGNNEKRSCWAIKIRRGRYTVIDDFGKKWGGEGHAMDLAIDLRDILREFPAALNPHGTMEEHRVPRY